MKNILAIPVFIVLFIGFIICVIVTAFIQTPLYYICKLRYPKTPLADKYMRTFGIKWNSRD